MYSTSLSEAERPDPNHAKPAAAISSPVRLPGRRHHANRPVPTNDQPTSRPSAGDEPAVVDVAAREDDRRVRDAGREAGDREKGYSPTARFGASPQSCSRR